MTEHSCSCHSAHCDVCRFERALRDPVDAQVDAAVAVVYAQVGGPPEAAYTWTDVVRAALKAAGAVVLDRPPCAGCGRPMGTGSLLDFRPSPPKLEPGEDWTGIPAEFSFAPGMIMPSGEKGMSLEMWREFAARYRCPACAVAENIEQGIEAFHESGGGT